MEKIRRKLGRFAARATGKAWRMEKSPILKRLTEAELNELHDWPSVSIRAAFFFIKGYCREDEGFQRGMYHAFQLEKDRAREIIARESSQTDE